MTRSSNSKRLISQYGGNSQQPNDTSGTQLDDRTSTSTTVAAVRALIAQTKEARKSKDERHKRGEYHRYTPEIREAIAVHAIRHGTRSAARTFSASLGSIDIFIRLLDETVSNLKTYNFFYLQDFQ